MENKENFQILILNETRNRSTRSSTVQAKLQVPCMNSSEFNRNFKLGATQFFSNVNNVH